MNAYMKAPVFVMLTSLFCTGAWCAETSIAEEGDTEESRPNLIVFLTDDQGYSDVGCYGAEGFATPNMDRMAQEGIRFTSFYANASCSPSRAALLTGCYAQRLGIKGPINTPDTGLNPDEITLAELLKNKGYATALIGKWHLGLPDEMSPIAQGFDYFSGLPLSQIRHGKTEHTDGPRAYYKRQWKKMGVGIETEIEYAPDETLFTQVCTAEALAFIRENHEKPFFLYLAQPQVHKEVLASKDFQGRTARGSYGDACEELDWSMGEVFKTLKSLGIDEKTMVVFCSDNGPWLGQGDQSGTAEPLRGGKFSTWEGGVRVPCIMRWPGRIPPGLVTSEVASIMDISPTFTRLVGVDMPKDRIIDGKDLWPLISGDKDARSPHEVFYYYHKFNLEAVRSGKWKLHYDKKAGWELYDLAKDIGEQHDVSDRNPEVVDRMMRLLESSRADIGDQRLGITGKNVRPLGKF